MDLPPSGLLRASLAVVGPLAALVIAAAPAYADPPAPAPAEDAARGGSAVPAGPAPAAQLPPARPKGEPVEHAGYSPYESATIDRALARLGSTIATDPEGKVVEAIDVVPIEVIEDRDPAPGFLNWFHATTRPRVIRREVLLGVGRPYAQVLADETARNLRGADQLSLVLVVAVRGGRPDRVRVLVITKDVWSLRLNSNYRIAGGRLEYLLLQPSEQNLFGIHHTAAVQIALDPGSLSLGAGYTIPRIGGSRVQLRAEANAILNRDTGDAEGSFGSFVYGQPLYATEAEWAWGAKIEWRNEVTRRFIGGRLAGFKATDGDDIIPYVHRSDLLVGSYGVTRSFGGRPQSATGSARLGGVKHDVTVGIAASRKIYRAGDLSAFAPAAAAEFERTALPVSDARIYPTLEYRTYSTSFARVLDFNTLALQEDFRVGHDVALRLYPVTTALHSSRDFLGVAVTAGYTAPFGDGIARLVVESITEIQRTRLPDASIEVSARVESPRLVVGRIVLDARLFNRYRNYLNRRSDLGGDTRLRGYPSGSFIGKDVLSANLEWRTRPIEIWSCQLAGAAFFDAGDAFNGWGELQLKESAGFGARLLFPQLQRIVMRADWGFPVTPGYKEPDSFPGDIIVTFGQAFPMPSTTN